MKLDKTVILWFRRMWVMDNVLRIVRIKPTNKCVGSWKKAHVFRVELGGAVGFDSRRSRFVFVLGTTTNMVASKRGERRMFAKYDEEEYSDDVNYDDKIVNEEATIGFVKSEDDDVSQKDNSRNDENVLWNLLKESIMLGRNLRDVAYNICYSFTLNCLRQSFPLYS
nr:hypothetical protein [Tanacetum cinerariifolium]